MTDPAPIAELRRRRDETERAELARILSNPPRPGCSRTTFDVYRTAYLSQHSRAFNIVLAGVVRRTFRNAGLTARAGGHDIDPSQDEFLRLELEDAARKLEFYVSAVQTTYELERFHMFVRAIPRLDDYLDQFCDVGGWPADGDDD